MAHDSPTPPGSKHTRDALLRRLIQLGVDAIALDYQHVPISPQAIAYRNGALYPGDFLRIGLRASGRQVVLRLSDGPAFHALCAIDGDPLAIAVAPRVRLRGGVSFVILASDGGLRAGDIGPGVTAIASYAPAFLGDVVAVDGGGPPPVSEAIINRLNSGDAAQEQADSERESFARTRLAKADYPTDLESLLAQVDTLQAIGFSEGLCEMHMSDRWPDESLEGAIQNAVSLAYGQGRAGHACEGRAAVDWVLESVLPAAAVGLLIGLSQSGKTFAALDLAIAAGSGGAFFGHRFEGPVGVVILTGRVEQPELVEPRLAAMAADRGLGLGDLAIIHGPCRGPGEVVPLVRRAARNIKSDFGFGLGLIIVDSLNGIFGVDEDNEVEAARIMADLRNLAEEHGATSILLHHLGVSSPPPTRELGVARGGQLRVVD